MSGSKAGKKDLVYNEVLKEVILGNYNYTSLITEKALVDKYGVSKSPVREALLDLCSEDVLESIPRLGYRVKVADVKDLADATDFRLIVELAALEDSFPRITNEKIEELEKICAEVREYGTDLDHYTHWQENSNFHLTLCSYSGNKFYAKTLKSLLRTCFFGTNAFFRDVWSSKNASNEMSRHELIIETLKARDLEKAKKHLEDDITSYRNLPLR